MPWKKIGWGILILDLCILNGVIGFGLYKYLNQQLPITDVQTINTNQIARNQSDVCGFECQKMISERIDALKIELAAAAGPSAIPKTTIAPTSRPSPTTKVAVGSVVRQKVQTITYVTIPGSGSSQINNWEDMAGTEFYFNPADYPGLKDVYFEANIKLFNGNGTAFIRLYDATHGIGVQGSDIQTNSQTNNIIVSGRLSFWTGNNLIKVQAKTLTADTAVFNSGRLKIIQEN